MKKNARYMTTLQRLYQRLNGSTIEYDLTQYEDIVHDIKHYETSLKQKTDQQLKEVSQTLAFRAQHGETLDDLLREAYALVREVSGRVLRLQPFDMQMIGGIVLHQGKLAEMQTGEGKTLTAVFPACLNALTGKGVHVLTFNDYLARRDAQWMGPMYQFLGLSVGYVQEGMSIGERQRAYSSDLTYLTAKEAGFDFLRDSLCAQPEERVQQALNAAIIDEADSILIDEARIPLVIAGAAENAIPDTYRLAYIVQALEYGRDVEFDDAARNVYLTDAGLERTEQLLHCDNVYAAPNLDLLTRLNCALHAQFLLQRDIDYIVRHAKIELVDEFTGRIADKRRWPDGLQAALEAKENIPIQTQGTILNSITLQHFLQLYPKICGMTATAQAAEEEFRQFYNLPIVVIPPNRPCIRIDHPDLIFKTHSEKTAALVHEIISVNRTKRPIVVGTRSVEESTLLAQELRIHGVACEVLNAKNDEYEARIIAQAGKLGAVTISTNMAGRGTDIHLGGLDEQEKSRVMALGGLYVIGTNRHESQRIDRQLRGRAGRQGDHGSSRFFISLEDDLFVKYRLQDLFSPEMSEDHQQGAIDNAMLRREIDRMQRIIEGQHLEIKKTLCKYSALIEQQREIMFEKRADVLNTSAASEFFASHAMEKFQEYIALFGVDHVNRVCQNIFLACIDAAWSQYLADIAEIREGIHLHRIGGQDPFFEFQKFAVTRFADVLKELEENALRVFMALRLSRNEEELEDPALKTPSATWTYIINDDPFEHRLDMQLLGNTGLSSGAAFMPNWPLMLLYLIVRKFKKQKIYQKNRQKN